MTTKKELIEQVIALTEKGSMEWIGENQVKKDTDNETMPFFESRFNCRNVLYNGNLLFQQDKNTFIIGIDELEKHDLDHVLLEAIQESMKIKIPTWVIDGLWSEVQGR